MLGEVQDSREQRVLKATVVCTVTELCRLEESSKSHLICPQSRASLEQVAQSFIQLHLDYLYGWKSYSFTEPLVHGLVTLRLERNS